MKPTQTELLLDRAARLNGGVVRMGKLDSALAAVLAEAGHTLEPNTLSQVLASMVERGDAIRLGKGVFALRDAQGGINPVAIGPRLAYGPAYVSMRTVAERAGLTTNFGRLVSVVTQRDVPAPSIAIPGAEAAVYFHRISETRFFGFTEQPTDDGLWAPLARPEKALLDMLWFSGAPDTPPAFEQMEMWEAAAASPQVNPRALVGYAVRMDSPSLVRRTGYLMDRFDIDGADDLLPHRGTFRGGTPLFGLPDEVGGLPKNRWDVV